MKSVKMNALVIALASLGLAACGGSSTQTRTTTTTVNNPTTAKPTTNKPTTGGVVGRALKVTSSGQTSELDLNGGSDVNEISIDGKTFTLIPSGFNVGGFYSIADADKELKVGGNGTYNYSRWGFYKDKATGNSYAFAQGKLTDTMPTTGVATYKGGAVYRDASGLKEGTSSFDVNFGDKKLSGSITPNGGSAISLSAAISGNKFSGIDATSNYEMKGGFAGSNAAELAGTYGHPNKTGGAFGAVKQ